jgi:DNA (cytosine-5)-methyltransferase 1
MNELALFAGAGGGILAGRSLGWRTVCAVEIDAYPASVLVHRQNEGDLDPFPIWDDVRTFDGRPWRGRVDVISGGFPCQDISPVGSGRGLSGAKSGLWSEFARIISEVRPAYVFMENSPSLTHKGLEIVLGDLASMGFDAEWGVLGASDVGAPHARERIWLVAYSNENGPGDHRLPIRETQAGTSPASVSEHEGWNVQVSPEPLLGRVADGMARGVDDGPRIAALGNGQVPQCAAVAWRFLCSRLPRDRIS